MRAGAFLDALTMDHQVTVLVVPVAGGSGSARAADFTLRRAHRLAVLSLDDALDPLYSLGARQRDPGARLAALRQYPRPHLCRWATSPALRAATAAITADGAAGPPPFAVVVVLRSYLAPYAAPFLSDPPTDPVKPRTLRVLDLDDDERLTHQRLGEMFALQGRAEDALLAGVEAQKYARHEALWVPRFDLVLAVSGLHAAAVAERHPGAARQVVPNSVETPSGRRRQPWRGPALHLLFVGNLGYEPNVDAACWLAGEVVPRLRSVAGQVELRIAGANPAPAVAALAASGIEVWADPADLAPHYDWADVALAPLRAGGGTRIKILEAFAARVPVVASRIGAEGLAVRDGRHLLLADDASGLAAACRRLHDDRPLARRLAGNALALVRRRYARPAGVRHLREVLRAASAAGPGRNDGYRVANRAPGP
jgi:glycosyltransferase involved in cell wall biosynthesis